ncbi:hypothetical protein TESG_00420 [Trichophyton tonsurans CBS 112818]|uniref:Uncharacterized protein n=1 Tax=Trichophyton tonsurans (strain CBS 112818) TaxID=647933 RepID=F2RPI1_TRIT1|nr:hypothetical protein TESG_00420 [Trichophyton tonsurans CBS 112818]
MSTYCLSKPESDVMRNPRSFKVFWSVVDKKGTAIRGNSKPTYLPCRSRGQCNVSYKDTEERELCRYLFVLIGDEEKVQKQMHSSAGKSEKTVSKPCAVKGSGEVP